MDSLKNATSPLDLKSQHHLSLLREEYLKLQVYANKLEVKYASSCPKDNENENQFIKNLLNLISSLYNNPTFSDLEIKFPTKNVPAHRFVLAARSPLWSEKELVDINYLDWSHLDSEICELILKFIYSDCFSLVDQHDSIILQLMLNASRFVLCELVSLCERALIASVDVSNCIPIYSITDEIGADKLKEHCSNMISTHWYDFTSADFVHMSATLLNKMLKSKTQCPLHSAIRLNREDVIFLYLVENSDDGLVEKLNLLDERGELPLEIAVRNNFKSIANTLIQHGANPDAVDSQGYTMVFKALSAGNTDAANFLLDHGARIDAVTPDTKDSYLHVIASCSPRRVSEEIFRGMTQIAKALLDEGLDPNMQNYLGFAPIHLAVINQNEEIFEVLNFYPTNINLRTSEGHTPLYYSLLISQLYNANSLAARLVERNADPNPIYPKTNDSLLHVVAQQKEMEEAGLFLCPHVTNINHVNSKGESALHIACRLNHYRLVTKLLECGADPNIQTLPQTEEGESSLHWETPLHQAVFYESREAVKSLLDYKSVVDDVTKSVKVDVNVKDSRGNTPLSLAINQETRHFVSDLIKEGADINLRNGQGYTLLHSAIINKNSTTAEFLLKQGANTDAKTPDNLTPLQLAIKHELPSVVEALCRRGVDLSTLDENKNCPLWAALDAGQKEIASILVRHGVDTDFWSEGPEGCLQTLLHRAIDENRESIASFLIQSGCDHSSPRKPGPDGRGGDESKDEQSPLHLCCQWGLENVVQSLIEHEANVNAKDIEGKMPLHVAIENHHINIVSLLLCHPFIDLSGKTKAGLTPFASALAHRNNVAAKAIRDKLPATSEQFDHKGRNFLHMAIQKHDVETVLFLLSINVDVNAKVQDLSQLSPLHLAAQAGDEMLLRSLLLAGARIDDQDAHRRTALHVAAEAGHAAIVSALLGDNANFNAVDSEGDNALHIAVREGNLGVVRTLLTESRLDAEAVNLKGRNPLHVLSRYARDNASSICDLFIESMPNYPLDKPDLEGNTALLLAYIKGNGNLCRTLVKAGASLGAMNKQRVTIFNYQVATKTLLKKLLDHLSQEPRWVDGDTCLECGNRFGLTQRKHHCRHCGRLLCSKCSNQEMPIIKFNLNRPVRVCTICFDVLQVGLT